MGFVSESGKLPMDEVTECVLMAHARATDEDAPDGIAAIFPLRDPRVLRGRGAALRVEMPVWTLSKLQLATILGLYHEDCQGHDIEVESVGTKVVSITRSEPEEEDADANGELPLGEGGDES